MSDPLKPLIIGDLELKTPILQGGMGVRVSTAPLAAAVADCGAGGTIASVALGFNGADLPKDYAQVSLEALRQEIRTARSCMSRSIHPSGSRHQGLDRRSSVSISSSRTLAPQVSDILIDTQIRYSYLRLNR